VPLNHTQLPLDRLRRPDVRLRLPHRRLLRRPGSLAPGRSRLERDAPMLRQLLYHQIHDSPHLRRLLWRRFLLALSLGLLFRKLCRHYRATLLLRELYFLRDGEHDLCAERYMVPHGDLSQAFVSSRNAATKGLQIGCVIACVCRLPAGHRPESSRDAYTYRGGAPGMVIYVVELL
jgi:hypothetical protein